MGRGKGMIIEQGEWTLNDIMAFQLHIKPELLRKKSEVTLTQKKIHKKPQFLHLYPTPTDF